MNSDNIKYLLREFSERPLPECHARELLLPTDSGKVIGLYGVRRSGKTFLFFNTIRQLVAKGIDRRRIVYINFEDDRLQPIRAPELDLIMRAIREVFPSAAGERIYMFLDEVQNVPEWERWVRRLHDTENIDIFITGSSSRVLLRDLSSAMRGRSVALEVFPLSFREYLSFKGHSISSYNANDESNVRAALEEYLHWGGFPEVVVATPAMKPLILEEYSSVMLYHDLVQRHALRNELLIRSLLRHCFRNTATMFNASKLHRDFKSLGFSVSKNTLFEYMELLADARLVFFLTKQETSLRKQAHNPRKIHVVDPGLITAFKAGAAALDAGHRLETAVFLECRRRSKIWHYYSNGSEVDLCSEDGGIFLNVCWNLDDPATFERETAAMAFGHERWPEAKGYLLFHEYSSATAAVPNAIPAWRWLLGQEEAGV